MSTSNKLTIVIIIAVIAVIKNDKPLNSTILFAPG